MTELGFSGNPRRVGGGVAVPDRTEPAVISAASGEHLLGSQNPAADPVESRLRDGGAGAGAHASAPNRIVPHGTSNGYARYGCRCGACRAAETQRQREFRARQRAGKVKHRTGAEYCVPVSVRGQVYPSISAAASALGVSSPSISHQLRKFGCADRAGLGLFGPRNVAGSNGKPCRIHGRDFPSVAAAARYLGVGATHLYRSMRLGVSPSYSEFLLAKLMQADARQAVAA